MKSEAAKHVLRAEELLQVAAENAEDALTAARDFVAACRTFLKGR